MWEYWNYRFRRMVLRGGWENDEWNYDRYLVEDETVSTSTNVEFFDALARWVPDPARLLHYSESDCPE
jgi:hypothetical protein